MTENPENEPKIFVDEDWKSQVEREKQAPAEPVAAEPAAAEVASIEPAATEPVAKEETQVGSDVVPPPAGFETLVTMLFTQALAALGQIPGPDGKSGEINKSVAKYFIDTLDMLGEKTAGNLTPEESQLLSETLHGMRMAYVSIKAPVK
jgi:hypothetical protein